MIHQDWKTSFDGRFPSSNNCSYSPAVVTIEIIAETGDSSYRKKHLFFHIRGDVSHKVAGKLWLLASGFALSSSQASSRDKSLASKSPVESLSIKPLLALSAKISSKNSALAFSGMNKELILRLMLSSTCFLQAKKRAIGSCADRPFTIAF